MLSDANSLEVVAEAGDGVEAICAVEKHKPELLDLSMPILGGMSVIKEIRTLPETKILILTMHDSEDFILTGLQVVPKQSEYLLLATLLQMLTQNLCHLEHRHLIFTENLPQFLVCIDHALVGGIL